MVKKSDMNKEQNSTDINMDAVTDQFASNLRAFIEQHEGLTQKKLAEAIDYSPAAVCGFLKKDDPNPPSLPFLLQMKRVYGISIDDFLTKNITPTDYNVPHSDTKFEEKEKQAYMRFVGTYLLYYFDTSSYKGYNYDSPSKSLRFGILHIYATPSDLDKFSHSVVCITGIENRDNAITIRNEIDEASRLEDDIVSYIQEHYSDKAYYGDFDLSETHAFISMKHNTNRDQALIILHRPHPNQPLYNSGIGTINSISHGREAMPTIQFIGLSRNNTSLSDEELHQMLLLDHTTIKDSPITDSLINLIKKEYESKDESISDYQRDIMVKGAISAYVRKVVAANLFRVAKISNKDDDSWYHQLKDTFIDIEQD